MRLIESVQIPLLSVPPPKVNRLVKWYVSDGSHVTIGQHIFDFEFDGVIFEVASFFTGSIKIQVDDDSEHEIGDTVATIVCDEVPDDHRFIGIQLANSQLSQPDKLRGDSPRCEYLREFVSNALQETSQANNSVG